MKVFISYSSKDEKFVKKLYDFLTRDRVTCFMDKEKIKHGQNWVTSLEMAINNCDAILYITSPNFYKSKWVERERSSAIAANKKQFAIIFKKVSDKKIPPFMKTIQMTDLSSDNKFDKNYPGICESLGGITKSHLFHKPNKGMESDNKVIISALMCNRGVQEEEFIESFMENIRTHPKNPQFYFIHGCSNDAHSDLIERFRMTIKKIMKHEFNKDVIPGSIKAEWPVDGKLKNRKNQLKRNIIRQFDNEFGGAECTIKDVCGLECMADSEVFFIRHELRTSKWYYKKRLITWYIEKFFSDIDWKSGKNPLFLIFFKIKYNEKSLLSWLMPLNTFKKIINTWRINRLIKKVQSNNKKDKKDKKLIPCQFISSLNPISLEEFEGWINEYIKPDWGETQKILKSIYNKKNKMLMGEIRDDLIEIENKGLRLKQH